MGLPGHRRTSSDKRRRAAHFALKPMVIRACAKCSQPVRPHHACAKCGTYNGRQAISTDRALARALKKADARAPSAPAPKAETKKAPKA